MSNKPTDGGTAFPCHTNPRPGILANAPQGMSLRAYFAGQFLTSKVWEKWEEKRAAKAAVQYADALVAELNIDTQQSPLTNAVTETTAVRLAILIVNDIMTDGGNGAKAKRLLLETPGSLYPSKMSGWSENALIERITGIIKAALQQTNIE